MRASSACYFVDLIVTLDAVIRQIQVRVSPEVVGASEVLDLQLPSLAQLAILVTSLAS
jgi:hypothetical protein